MIAARIPGEVALVDGRAGDGGWRWVLLTTVLIGGAVGSVAHVGFQRLMRWGTCYDIQGDPDTQRACDDYPAKIAGGSWVVLAVAALSAVVMVPIGITDGARGLRFAAGPAWSLWLLVAGDPAAFAAYLTGWLLGRTTRRLARRT